MNDETILKICPESEWAAAQAIGLFRGSALDIKDGFIHCSTPAQMPATAARYFAGQQNLVILEIAVARLDAVPVWEESRGGELFPHLYAPLPCQAVVAVRKLAVHRDGKLEF